MTISIFTLVYYDYLRCNSFSIIALIDDRRLRSRRNLTDWSFLNRFIVFGQLLFILQFRRIFFININISFIHYFWGHWHVNRSMLLRNINWSLQQLTIIFVKKLNILDSAKIWSVLMLI